MKLEKAVPFGRSLDEYTKLFAFSDAELDKKIVSVGDGPASFNAEMTGAGRAVVSIDPLYNFQAKEIEQQFFSVVDNIISQVKATPSDWVWSYHQSPEQLKENRIAVLRRFLADFEKGKSEGRYRVGECPSLDFDDNEFDIAICSHFLFLYSDHFTYQFHRDSILEMLRIAPEVRIFPLLTLNLIRSPYLQPLNVELEKAGFTTSIEKVDYEFQKGGNEMLRIQRKV